MNARDIMIRIFAKGGAAAATEFQKPAQAAEKTGQALDGTANKSEQNTRRVVTHAQQMRRAFSAVALSAVAMGGRVQSGTATGAQGVAVMTRQVERLDRAMQRANDQASKFGNVKGSFQQAGTAGMVTTGAAAGGAFVIGRGLGLAGQKELELKSIEAFEGGGAVGKSKADSIYKEIDGMSTTSVFELTDLTAAGKDLSKNRMFNKRYLTAADDLAAANKADGVDPKEVTRVYGRLKAGDYGEAFERARDFGISKSDLEAQGAKFSKSNEFEGTSEEAIEFFTRAIEAKFKGLSNTLATETMAGAFSNLADAGGRAATAINEELVPAVTTGTRWLTSVAGVFSNLPSPVRKFIAFGGVIGVVLLAAAGAGLMLVSMLGQAALGWLTLCSAMGTGTGLTAALTGATTAQGAAAGTATIGTQALATSLLSRLVPAMLTSMGVLILGAIAIYGFAAAIDGTAKAAKQSDEELKKHWSGLGSFWVAASEALTKLMSHPMFRILTAANPLGVIAQNVFGANNQAKGDADEKESLRLTNESRKRKGLKELTLEDYRKGKNEKTGGMSDNDKEASRGDNPELSESSAKAPGTSATPGMPTKADIEKYQKQAQELLAQQPATGMESLSAPTVNGSGPAATMPASFGNSGSAVDDLKEQILHTEDADTKKALNKRLFYARRAEAAQKEAERDKKSEKRAAEKETKKQERALRKQQREIDTTERARDSHQKRVDAELAREALEAEIAQVRAMQRSRQISKEQAESQITMLRRNARRRALGMEAGGSGASLGAAGGQNGTAGATVPISEAEKGWLGYARQSVESLSKDEAFRFVNKQSAYFEKGGFEGEGEMAAWQRAYMEKHGAANFKNSMFPQGLNNWRSPKPGAVSGAANLLSFGNGSGDASTTAGGANRPQSADQLLEVRAKTQIVQNAGRRILKIIVPDVHLEDSFAHAVGSVRRR